MATGGKGTLPGGTHMGGEGGGGGEEGGVGDGDVAVMERLWRRRRRHGDAAVAMVVAKVAARLAVKAEVEEVRFVFHRIVLGASSLNHQWILL